MNDSYRCVCGDARTEEAFDRLLGSERADLLLADPPYCLLTRRRKGGDLREPKGRKLDHDLVVRFDTVRDYRTFTEAWLPKAIARLRADAFVVLWTNFLGKAPLLTVARSCGYAHLWGEFVWAKRTSQSNGSEQILRVYEVALVLAKSAPPVADPGELPRAWSVVAGYDDEGEAQTFGSHPHHKPLGVLEPLVRTYSRPGDLILDPFAGSGSIPAAACRLDRRAACMDLVPEWADRVSDRLLRAKS